MNQTPWLAFSIDRSSKTPVFEQLCQAIRELIIADALAEGAKLPPTREFAIELGVSRSTVVTAYEQLVAEGYLISRAGSGYTVCAIGEVELQTRKTPPQNVSAEEQPATPMPFEAGHPDMRLFPHRQWAKAVSRVCRTHPQSMLVGGSAFGNFDLRKAIAAHVFEWRGIKASAQQVIITAGSTDALEICMRALTDTGETIGLENPGYTPTRHFAKAHGLSVSYLDVDANGAQLPSPQDKPGVVVLTPSHQYPLGGAMSPNRRLEFLHWATKTDAWILEDDYDSEFRYAGRPIPAMAGFDGVSRTIYIGSFSKIFSNSLRLGYVIVPNDVLDQFRAGLTRYGLKASYLPQQALAEFMESGEFYRHLRRVRRVYRERWKFVIGKLASDFTDFGGFRDHQAGMQIVFHLHARFQDAEISRRALEKGVTVRALSEFSVHKSGHNGLILGFCGYSEDEMTPALQVLKSCIY